MRKTAEILFSLIRYEIFGGEYCGELSELEDEKNLAAVCTLAAFHEMAHLVADALGRLSVVPADENLANALGRQQLKVILRAERMDGELAAISEIFEREKIEFLPLKGSVIRDFYPEKWMRTSCDMDILVHKEDIERASELLLGELGYVKTGGGDHDVAFSAPSGIRLELHFKLNNDGRGFEALDRIWGHTYAKEENSYRRYLDDGMFYFYHMAHMAKHMEGGGCGIKPLLDLCFIPAAGEELLEKNGLKDFSDTVRKLSRVWFDGEEHDSFTSELEAFILRAGVYGNVNNAVAVGQSKRGGRGRYILSKFFLSYDTLKYQYPVLQKHKWLIPVCHVRRWFRLLFKGGAQRSANEIKVNSGMSQERSESVAKLFEHLGINR